MWVQVRLLRDVPEMIGNGWYKGGSAGSVLEYPDVVAARLIAEGSAELAHASGELSEHLASLLAHVETQRNLEEMVAAPVEWWQWRKRMRRRTALKAVVYG